MMRTIPSTPAEEFLIVCMAYCMTWELTGIRAVDHWSHIRAFLAGENGLDEQQRWVVELYEEGPPSAQEERSIRARIDAYLLRPRDVVNFRRGILDLLPESLRDAAATHSFMHGLEMPLAEYGKLKSWVMRWKVARYHAPIVRVLPLAEREADFNRFLEQPYFVQSFRRFWRVGPKCRDNRSTRVLVCISAALSQMVRVDEVVDFDLWTARLTDFCHFTQQTKQDLRSLMDEMAARSYDVQELAYWLSVDVRAVDQQSLKAFIACYSEELSALAPELARGMEYASV